MTFGTLVLLHFILYMFIHVCLRCFYTHFCPFKPQLNVFFPLAVSSDSFTQQLWIYYSRCLKIIIKKSCVRQRGSAAQIMTDGFKGLYRSSNFPSYRTKAGFLRPESSCCSGSTACRDSLTILWYFWRSSAFSTSELQTGQKMILNASFSSSRRSWRAAAIYVTQGTKWSVLEM